VFSQHSTIPII